MRLAKLLLGLYANVRLAEGRAYAVPTGERMMLPSVLAAPDPLRMASQFR